MGVETPAQSESAPEAMLANWAMPGLVPGRPVTAGPSMAGDLDEQVRLEMYEQGYTGTLGTAVVQEYLGPVRIGDVVSVSSVYTEVSAEKMTSLGAGYFLVYDSSYADQTGRALGRQTTTLLHFSPAAEGGRPPATSAALRPASGSALLDQYVLLSATQVVAGALATRDFYPVHHDPVFARAHGSRDIVLNLPTTIGLVATRVQAWLPGSPLTRLRVRLRSSAYPGVPLRFSGSVTDHESGRRRSVSVDVVQGERVHANAEVELGPDRR